MDDDNVALDIQVDLLRSHLNDPLRVAQVSGSTFPLQVWERMFALDREKRAVDASKRHEDHHQQQQLEQTNRSTNNEHADRESTFSGGSRQTSPSSMGSMSSFGDPLGQIGFGGASKRKPPQLRNCRDGSRLNSSFMRSLVRDTLHPTEAEQKEKEQQPIQNGTADITAATTTTALRQPITTATTQDGQQQQQTTSTIETGSKGKNLFGMFASITTRKEPQIPTAVLSCVSVPERLASPQKNNNNNNNSPTPPRKDYNGNALVLLNSPSSPACAVTTTVITANNSKRHQQQQQQQQQSDHHSVGSFRAHPIRPFSPISSFWGNNVTNGGAVDGGGGFGRGSSNNAVGGGAAGNGTVIGAEFLRQQMRLQAYARPAVERHDLPFEVTEANDFRQLQCPLTGLGHAVPYEDLQQEQKYLMSLCSNNKNR